MAGAYITNSFVALMLLLSPWGVGAEDLVVSGRPSPSTVTVAQPALIEPGSWAHLLQVGLMLLLVIMAILVVAWLVKRMGMMGGGREQHIRYLGGLTVGQRERVVLIEVGNTQLLIGVAPGRVSALHTLEQPIVVKEAVGDQPSFAMRLSSALLQGGKQ